MIEKIGEIKSRILLFSLCSSLLFCNCRETTSEPPDSGGRVIELGFSVGYNQDTISVFYGGKLLERKVITTNVSIGSAYVFQLNEYGLYKVIVNDSDTLEVNISQEYPIAHIYKDSALGVECASAPRSID